MTTITSENFIQHAEANGITYKTAWRRVHELGWEPHDAATIPAGSRRPTPMREAIRLARSNGISRSTFEQRMRYGWSMRRATTEPVRHYFRDSEICA